MTHRISNQRWEGGRGAGSGGGGTNTVIAAPGSHLSAACRGPRGVPGTRLHSLHSLHAARGAHEVPIYTIMVCRLLRQIDVIDQTFGKLYRFLKRFLDYGAIINCRLPYEQSPRFFLLGFVDTSACEVSLATSTIYSRSHPPPRSQRRVCGD